MEEECVKVWGWDETEPPDGNMSNLDSAPPGWFREGVSYAAELYLAERNMPPGKTYTVYVKSANNLYTFEVKEYQEVKAETRCVNSRRI